MTDASQIGSPFADAWIRELDVAIEAINARPGEERVHYLIRHGTMRVGLYAPLPVDDQTPHTQDEVYLVLRGTGTFNRDGASVPFAPGAVIFVPAGQAHSFTEFSDNFQVFVVFWGPSGGERTDDRVGQGVEA